MDTGAGWGPAYKKGKSRNINLLPSGCSVFSRDSVISGAQYWFLLLKGGYSIVAGAILALVSGGSCTWYKDLYTLYPLSEVYTQVSFPDFLIPRFLTFLVSSNWQTKQDIHVGTSVYTYSYLGHFSFLTKQLSRFTTQTLPTGKISLHCCPPLILNRAEVQLLFTFGLIYIPSWSTYKPSLVFFFICLLVIRNPQNSYRCEQRGKWQYDIMTCPKCLCS